MAQIDSYLRLAHEKNASDLHFLSGDPLRARIHGELTVIGDEKLSVDHVRECISEIMDGVAKRQFE